MGNPSFTQVAARFRNDDGSETTATWRQSQNVNDTVPVETRFRLRFLIDNTTTNSWSGVTWNLRYSYNGGAYTLVPNTRSTADPVFLNTSPNFANGDNTTSQLTGGSGTFVTANAGMRESTMGSNSGTSQQFFDMEFSLVVDGYYVNNSDTVSFRLYNGNQAIAAYTFTPQLTVSKTAASMQQLAFGFYTDANVDTGPFLDGAQNTNHTQAPAVQLSCFLRFLVQEQNVGYAGYSDDWWAQYRKNNGSWLTIGAANSNVHLFDSANITDNGMNIGGRLTGGSGSNELGNATDTTGQVNNKRISKGNNMEFVWTLQTVPADVANGDYLDFRILRNGTVIETYTSVPRITFVTPAPTYDQNAFRFYADGTESGSTALANQDTNYTADVSSSDLLFALRARVQETVGSYGGATTDDWGLYYQKNGTGGYLPVYSDHLDLNEGSTQTPFSTTVYGIGQSFTGDGFDLRKIRVKLQYSGSPTGNLTLSVYAHSGTFGSSSVGTGSALATSGSIAASSINGNAVDFVFTGANQITLTNGTKYVLLVEYSSADASNYIYGYATTSNSHAGNLVKRDNAAAWSYDASIDLPFEIITNKPIVPANSPNLSNGASTTNRLTGGSGTFLSSGISEDGLVDNKNVTAGNFTELLYALNIQSADVANNDTVDFRVYRNGVALNAYTVTPRITISKGTTSVNENTAWVDTEAKTFEGSSSTNEASPSTEATSFVGTPAAENETWTGTDANDAVQTQTLVENQAWTDTEASSFAGASATNETLPDNEASGFAGTSAITNESASVSESELFEASPAAQNQAWSGTDANSTVQNTAVDQNEAWVGTQSNSTAVDSYTHGESWVDTESTSAVAQLAQNETLASNDVSAFQGSTSTNQASSVTEGQSFAVPVSQNEASSHTEASAFAGTQTQNETLPDNEASTHQASALRDEGWVDTEAQTAQGQLTYAQNWTGTDANTNDGPGAPAPVENEYLPDNEATTFVGSKTDAESFSGTDTPSLQTSVTNGETFAGTQSNVSVPQLLSAEAFTGTEGQALQTSITNAESFTGTEGRTFSTSVIRAETFTGTESNATVVSFTHDEAFTGTDSPAMGGATAQNESLVNTEGQTYDGSVSHDEGWIFTHGVTYLGDIDTNETWVGTSFGDYDIEGDLEARENEAWLSADIPMFANARALEEPFMVEVIGGRTSVECLNGAGEGVEVLGGHTSVEVE